MKKIISTVLLILMVATVIIMTVSAIIMTVSADNAVPAVCPDWLITEIGVDNAGTTEMVLPYITNPLYNSNKEPFEFIEITNISGRTLNIYDYAVFNCTASPTSTSFETLVYKTEPIKPDNWVEWDWGDPALYWDTTVNMPLNPPYEQGIVEPGETIVLWMYMEGHQMNCVIDDFKAFWRIGEDVKVFLVDSNPMYDKTRTATSGAGVTIPYGGAAKNFNLKNSGIAAYGIMKWDETAREKFDAQTNKETGTGVYLGQENLSYITCDSIVCWALVFIPTEIMDFVENDCQTFNYIYSTTSAFYNDSGGKRCEYLFTADYLNATPGKLTEEQIASIPNQSGTPTTPPVETTEPPVGTTEPPVGTTEPPVGTTEPPVGTTEPPVGTTEPPIETTTAPPTEDTTTDEDNDKEPADTTTQGKDGGGCGSFIEIGVLMFTCTIGLVTIRRYKR